MKACWQKLMPILLTAMAGCGTFTKPQELVLVADGEPAANIILAESPTRAAQLAAFELQEHIREMTGATLPIVNENREVAGLKIFVGASRHAQAPEDFQAQEYAVMFRPDAMVIAGKDKEDFGEVRYWHSGDPPRHPRIDGAYEYMTWPEFFDEKGTLHAAYDFLEQYCGVRWFDQSEFGTDVPKNPTLKVVPQDIRRRPTFAYLDPQGRIKGNMEIYNRGASMWTIRWSESTPKYQEWLDLIYERGRKLPVCSHPHRWLGYERSRIFAFLLRRKMGGEPWKTNHSFYGWYDRFWEQNQKHPDVFVERRPDWFAQGYPEAKVPPQLCYSNPQVVAQCLEDAREFFALPEEERSKRRLGTDKYFPAVPMDNASYCQCPRCMELGPPGRVTPGFSSGDHSLRVWSFVNEIAQGLKRSNPDKMVAALAYASYAWRPKELKIEDNIAVQLCLFMHAAATNPDMLANDDLILTQWADGRPLYLWLYAGWTTGHKPQVPGFPKPMGNYLAPLLQKYHQAGVRGIFFDGMPQETDSYFLLKLAEDPYQDVDRLMNDYFVRMYGPQAGPTLQKFYQMVEGIYANPRNYPKGINGPELHFGILGTGPRMQELEKLVEQAEAELADAPELWKKRFAVFKFGTWDCMKQGRESYEKSKVSKASASISVSAPIPVTAPPGPDLAALDWRDAQSFGGFNGWLKDSGDVSLRKINSRMMQDGKTLYLSLVERDLERTPSRGDTWEILMKDLRSAMPRMLKLFIAPDGGITGQSIGEGAPQEWVGHGVTARSEISEDSWQITLALPLDDQLRDQQGRLFMNLRRNDATGEDSPVLVATGDQFDAASSGMLVNFDKAPTSELRTATVPGLILDWDFSGQGDQVADLSGNGNDGLVCGNIERVEKGIKISGGGQYVEIQAIKGLDPGNYTFTCWFNYPDAKRQGHLLFFRNGTVEARFSVPHQKMGFLNQDADGKVIGAGGPSGAELPPGTWHMLTLCNNGKTISGYENGRLRFTWPADKLIPVGDESAVWRFGSSPKRPPWYSFLGTLGRIQFYGRALSPDEVMAQYQAEFTQHRQ